MLTFISKLLGYSAAALSRTRGYHREFANIGWLIGDRAIRVFGTFLIGIMIARIMGPADFGGFSYAFTLVALLTLAVSLGLNPVVIKQLIDRPGDSHDTLGTACLLQTIAAVIVVTSLAIIEFLSEWQDDYVRLALIMALGLLFKPSEPIRYWFESQVSAKFAILADNAAFVAGAVLKIGSLMLWPSLDALAWATLVETVLGGIFLILIYRHKSHTGKSWSISRRTAMSLLKDGWPLLLAGLSIALYTRIDQVIIMAMKGPETTGIFSAAARISEMLYVLPTVVATTFFPRWQRLLHESGDHYASAIRSIMGLMVALCALISIGLLFAAPLIVRLLYGPAYLPSAPVLAIHIWTCVFVSMGVLGHQWYLSHGLQSKTLFCTMLGAVTNVVLNILLVPALGAKGAAISSVVAHAISGFLADAASPQSRPLFRLKVRLLFSPFYWIVDRIRTHRSTAVGH